MARHRPVPFLEGAEHERAVGLEFAGGALPAPLGSNSTMPLDRGFPL